tara:strand:+ start:910 stop:1185 length:276 start_codon:yes stop_codon:yes gene_type:complete
MAWGNGMWVMYTLDRIFLQKGVSQSSLCEFCGTCIKTVVRPFYYENITSPVNSIICEGVEVKRSGERFKRDSLRYYSFKKSPLPPTDFRVG